MLPVSVYYEDNGAAITLGKFLKEAIGESGKVVVICIGTDKYICDCLGPLVGSFLVEANIPVQVLGVLENPIHSGNIEVKIKEITNLYKDCKIIAIDGCLGNEKDIGIIKFREGSVNPGSAVSKKHTCVGDFAIEAIIEKKEVSDYLLELPIRLRYIYKIASVIRDAFRYALNDNK